jgi:hypothetical protein
MMEIRERVRDSSFIDSIKRTSEIVIQGIIFSVGAFVLVWIVRILGVV